MDAQHDDCINACHQCATACARCAAACLKEADVRAMARCIELDLDCEAVCRMSASALARGSELAGPIAALCEQACEACAQECARHDHRHCQDCASMCRRCAATCRELAH